MKSMAGLMALTLLIACQQKNENNAISENAPAPAPTSQPSNVAANEAPDERMPLAEPKGAIDPKSAEAAGQVAQHYGALIEQNRWAEAAEYWGDKEAAGTFAKDLQSKRLKHLEIGKLGEMEGAAGSSYVTMPVSFYGESNRSRADIILRRVNDVPGSTDAQRRWHIERIEWKG